MSTCSETGPDYIYIGLTPGPVMAIPKGIRDAIFSSNLGRLYPASYLDNIVYSLGTKAKSKMTLLPLFLHDIFLPPNSHLPRTPLLKPNKHNSLRFTPSIRPFQFRTRLT